MSIEICRVPDVIHRCIVSVDRLEVRDQQPEHANKCVRLRTTIRSREHFDMVPNPKPIDIAISECDECVIDRIVICDEVHRCIDARRHQEAVRFGALLYGSVSQCPRATDEQFGAARERPTRSIYSTDARTQPSELLDGSDPDGKQSPFRFVAEACNGGNIAVPRGPSWAHCFDAVGEIGALLTLEVDVKEGIVASGRNDLARNRRQRRPTKILDEPQVRG